MNEPAQLLAKLFQAGQEQMRQFTAAGGTGNARQDPTTAFVAASRHYAEMQQNFVKQMTGFWSAMLGAATPAEEAAAPMAKDEDRRFTPWTT